MDDPGRLRDAFDKASRAAGVAAVRQPVTEPLPSQKNAIRDLLGSVWELIEAQDADLSDLRARLAGTRAAARRAEVLEEQMRQVQDELEFVQQDREAKRQEVEQLRNEVRSLQEDLNFARQSASPSALATARPAVASRRETFEAWSVDALQPPAVPPPATEAPPPTAPPTSALPDPAPDASPADRLARAFAQWCTNSGAINGRADLFQTSLRASLPDADVRTVYRDADSPARPVVLRPDATGNSAVAYWLVSHDGRYALLPQPMGPQQFRELAPCFDGAAAPATLTAIEPAGVRPSGNGFELLAPGRVL